VQDIPFGGYKPILLVHTLIHYSYFFPSVFNG
jgi:hypothetical protein